MKQLAFIIKFNQADSPKTEATLERDIYVALKAFSDKEQEGFVMDDDDRTMIAFIKPEDKPKLDSIVEAANKVQTGIVSVYEDFTEKILYKNDFSLYSIKSKIIENFIKSRLKIDDVLDKINNLGMSSLTEVDMHILKAGQII